MNNLLSNLSIRKLWHYQQCVFKLFQGVFANDCQYLSRHHFFCLSKLYGSYPLIQYNKTCDRSVFFNSWLTGCPVARSHSISKPRDIGLALCDPAEIYHTSLRQCCLSNLISIPTLRPQDFMSYFIRSPFTFRYHWCVKILFKLELYNNVSIAFQSHVFLWHIRNNFKKIDANYSV